MNDIITTQWQSEGPMMQLFGTDGMRGIANREPMTSETILRVGRAIAFLAKQTAKHPSVLIGKDTRLSGYLIETALVTGICSMGVDVLLVGPLPTAAIAWLTHQHKVSRGVAITASHNPYRDNGIKIFDAQGFKISQNEESKITTLVNRHDIDRLRPIEEEIGQAFRLDDAQDRYVDYVHGTFPTPLKLGGLSIVLDCAHGAAYSVAPRIFESLGAKIHTLGTKPDGKNINADCGSEHPEGLQKAVISLTADIGIALDGDADRCVMVDEKGRILNGDQLLAIVGLHMLKKDLLHHRTIVLTEMSNSGLLQCLKDQGVQTVPVPVGDQNVVQAVWEKSYSLGGEQNGHLFFPKLSRTIDGLITGLQILAVVCETGKKLSELGELFQPWPQVLKNIPVRQKPPIKTVAGLYQEIVDAKQRLQGRGRVVVRYSGTESILRVMVESREAQEGAAVAQAIAEAAEFNL